MQNQKEKITAIDRLKQLVAEDLSLVNNLIIEHANSHSVELIPEIVKYITQAGGKRIRPLLSLASYHLCGGQGGFNPHILLATAVEYIHTATLLHDDVVDESSLRRGLSTSNNIWGNKTAILVGDFLFSKAFKLMVETNSLRALEILSEASTVIAEGEIWQMVNILNLDLTHAQYYEIIKCKTATLFAAACEASAVVSKVDAQKIAALKEYGMNFGLAFQIVDDILDYSCESIAFGKDVGRDFAEGKLTLPIIMLLAKLQDKDKAEVISLLQARSEEAFIKIRKMLIEFKVYDDCYNIVMQLVNKATTALNIFSDSEFKNCMIDLITESIKRTV